VTFTVQIFYGKRGNPPAWDGDKLGSNPRPWGCTVSMKEEKKGAAVWAARTGLGTVGTAAV